MDKIKSNKLHTSEPIYEQEPILPKSSLGFLSLSTLSITLITIAGCTSAPVPIETAQTILPIEQSCNSESAKAIANIVSGITIADIPNGPSFASGVKYVPATDKLPSYCQVTGSFVTNPKTGKTANFLATLPANWNGKYLQYGCFGHCGSLMLNDAASPLSTVINQGLPGDALVKGYASFGTDEGHTGSGGGSWAATGDRQADQDAIDDFLYRANKVLAHVGKKFTSTFYSHASAHKSTISRSYFAGCSGGGRGAMIAAAYFPEEFDGVIAGSPYLDMAGVGVQGVAGALSPIRSPSADISPELISRIDPIVKAECDKLDGVEDGLIQNPAACNFRPERDLPRCGPSTPKNQCFTDAQIKTVSTVLTAVTDEHGRVIQPGLSVSDFQYAMRVSTPPLNPLADEPWPNSDDYSGGNGLYPLGEAVIKVFARQNDPAFHTRSLFKFKDGGSGPVTAFRAIVPAKDAAQTRAGVRAGLADIPEDLSPFIQQNRKLLMWHNLSDQLLTPYMSINYYKRLAAINGGYEKLQNNVRLFALPGTTHCAGPSSGPNSFDALTAIENWVERGIAPEALKANLYEAKGPLLDFTTLPHRSMPLCKFPEMAHYKGTGDVKDASNWTCPVGDTSMLKIGESGQQAGVLE